VGVANIFRSELKWASCHVVSSFGGGSIKWIHNSCIGGIRIVSSSSEGSDVATQAFRLIPQYTGTRISIYDPDVNDIEPTSGVVYRFSLQQPHQQVNICNHIRKNNFNEPVLFVSDTSQPISSNNTIYFTLMNNHFRGVGSLSTIPASIIVKGYGNREYVTENSGAGTINNGSTNVTVTHSVSYTPSAAECTVTFTENLTNNPSAMWTSNITSTQFTVNVENDLGASNLEFFWAVERFRDYFFLKAKR